MCPGFSETHKNTSLWAWRAVALGTFQRLSLRSESCCQAPFGVAPG